jgi:L-iditol 2-dehydrogenase
MESVMRALVKESHNVALKEVAIPRMHGRDEVLINVNLAGLCRTDIYAAEGRIPCMDNVILGHEFAGTVVETSTPHLSEGDRVTVMPVMSCGRCEQCLSGAASKCQRTTMLGIDRDGAFAEYVCVSASSVHKLPESVCFKKGAFAEPVAAALSVLNSGVRPHEKGLIHGDNRFGHLAFRILNAYGFKDLTLQAVGQTLDESKFDFCVETEANSEVMRDLFHAVKPGGRVVLKTRKVEPIGINFFQAVRKELTLSAVNYGAFEEGLKLMADGRLHVDDLLGDVYAFEDFPAIVERARTFENAKSFFNPAMCGK